ncbi:RteC domain-containing protein [Capnocytophaga sp. ARDL2]
MFLTGFLKFDSKHSHHTFHRTKIRSKPGTSFLDELKKSLEEYMDKE